MNKKGFIEELAIYLKKYFNIKSSITKRKAYNLRKDGIITKPTRIYITGDSVKVFCEEIGFEGDKQKKLQNLLGVKGIPTDSMGI